MKNFKKIICLVLTLLLTLQLAACQKAKTDDKGKTDEVKTEEKDSYNEKWVLSPSIQAEAIYSLPIVSFNANTNHYDVSYGNAYVIKKNDKFGLIDSNGQLIFSPEFDSIDSCICYKGYIATVKESEYYTVTYHISPNGQKTWAYNHTCRGFDGHAYRWNELTGAVEAVKISEDTAYPEYNTPYLPETAAVTDGTAITGKYTLICGGKAVGKKNYTGAGVFTGGLAAMQSGGKWGYINSEGKTVIPFEFDAIEGYNALGYADATPFESSEGYVTVIKDGKFGIYTADGTKVIPCRYLALTTVHDGRAYATVDGKSWGILQVDEKISNGIKPAGEGSTDFYTEATSSTTTTTSAQTTTTTTTAQSTESTTSSTSESTAYTSSSAQA